MSSWRPNRLKNLAEIRVSNVDKRSADGETPIRLCNYTDVYNSDNITGDLDFMEATASREQIRQFALHRGDVLITKDSESPDDIAVPAFVPAHLPGVLCGYHLARLRPRRDAIEPRFLFWWFRSAVSHEYFSAAATGITRFGLRADSIGSAPITCPGLAVQRKVADFLDAETVRIDTVIAKKGRVQALVEKRWKVAAAEAMQSVEKTTGTIPLRRLVRCLDGRRVPLSREERSHRPGPFPYYGASGIIDHVDDFLFDEGLVLLGEDGAQLGDPESAIAQVVREKCWVNNHAHVLRPLGADADFLFFHLNTFDRGAFISGATREKITQDDMAQIPVPRLEVDDQRDVAQSLNQVRESSRHVRQQLDRQLKLLQERRQALITAAVTGQLHIPGVAA